MHLEVAAFKGPGGNHTQFTIHNYGCSGTQHFVGNATDHEGWTDLNVCMDVRVDSCEDVLLTSTDDEATFVIRGTEEGNSDSSNVVSTFGFFGIAFGPEGRNDAAWASIEQVFTRDFIKDETDDYIRTVGIINEEAFSGPDDCVCELSCRKFFKIFRSTTATLISRKRTSILSLLATMVGLASGAASMAIVAGRIMRSLMGEKRSRWSERNNDDDIFELKERARTATTGSSRRGTM